MLNSKTHRNQILSNFITMLEAEKHKQTTGTCFRKAEDDACYYCALGILWLAAGGTFEPETARPLGDDIVEKEPEAKSDRPYRLADELGLGGARIWSWNDSGASFPEIAENVRKYLATGSRVMQNTDPQYLERYANVYTLTKSIPDDIRFNMHYWGLKRIDSECGTAACMAGHAGLHPWFHEQGLILEPSAKDPGSLSPPGKSYHDTLEDIADFFGYNDQEMHNHPFDPDGSWYFEVDEDGEPALDKDGKLVQLFDGGRITPSIAAEALRNYMVEYWGPYAVQDAIEKAEAYYNIDFVHQFAKWE